MSSQSEGSIEELRRELHPELWSRDERTRLPPSAANTHVDIAPVAIAPALSRRRSRRFENAVRLFAIGLLYAAAASLCLTSFMQRWSLREEDPAFGLPSMLDQSGARPYVYRALLPTLAAHAIAAAPTLLKRALAERLDRTSGVQTRFFRAGRSMWTVDFSLAYHFVYFANFLLLLGSLFFLRALLRELPAVSFAVADFLPIGFCVLLPILFLCGGQLYDFCELFGAVAIARLAISRRHALLLALVPLAACNKETAILTTLSIAPLMIARWGLRRSAISAASVALGGAVVLAIHAHFRGNPGAPFECHLRENIAYWLHPDSYRQFTSILAPGVPFPKPQNLLMLAPLAAMLTLAYRRTAPRDERRWLVLALAIDLPLFLLLGYRDEIRALSLLFVPFTVFCARFFSLPELERRA